MAGKHSIAGPMSGYMKHLQYRLSNNVINLSGPGLLHLPVIIVMHVAVNPEHVISQLQCYSTKYVLG